MDINQHFRLMSKYNQRMNRQIYDVIKTLSTAQLKEDRGAYFKSIFATLNHILVGDLIWLRRFATHSDNYSSLQALSGYPSPATLDAIIYADINDLIKARQEIDRLIDAWLEHESKESDFDELHIYSDTKGIVSQREFGELVSHLFNHQTHHRGQLTTLLNQLDLDIGVTDFLIDIPDQHNNHQDS